MKILQIIQTPELRGAEIFACQLSEELIAIGHTVDVVYLFPNETFDLNFTLNFIPLDGVKKRRFRDFKAYKRLADIIRKGNYDLVQSNAGDTLKYAVFSRLLFRWRAPLVYRNANTMSSLISSSLVAVFNRFLLDHVQFIVSVSENSRQDIISFHPRVRTKCIAIPIGTYDFDHVVPLPATWNQFVVINSASFVREKNHLFLIRVFKKFSESMPNAVLWLVGDGPLRKKVKRLVETLALTEKVVFWGYRKDIISILKASDMMVMPSVIEGLPGAILEAFSCGVPVVASAVGGIPEVVMTDHTGICIKELDEHQYVKAMERLVQETELKKRVVTEAKKLVAADFLMPKIARRFHDAYSGVLNRTTHFNKH